MARILIVDDNEVTLKVIESILDSANHTYLTATSGYDAIELLEREKFDLLITDVNMPGGVSGFDLAVTVRAGTENKKLPIIFLTGRRDARDIQKAIESGADDYIVKPVDQEILLSKVSNLLNGFSGETSYAERYFPIESEAAWDSNFRVIGISERGIKAISRVMMPVNMKIKMDCKFFEMFEYKAERVRVISCEPSTEEEGCFLLILTYVGCSESDRQEIRRWVMSRLSKAS